MTRDAKVYIVNSQPPEKLIELFEQDDTKRGFSNVAIFEIAGSYAQVYSYAILNVSNEADEIIQNRGGILMDYNDVVILTLKDRKLIYGDKELLIFLPSPTQI